jgi:hypothetical protein
MRTLQFRRDLRHARPFELDALKCVSGLGGYYPSGRLDEARLEAQPTRPHLPVTEGNVAVFFRLINYLGAQVIEIVEQPYAGVFSSAGLVWASGDGRANLTITDTVVNGYFELESMIDGRAVEFAYEFGQYVSLDALQKNRIMKLKAA